MVSISDETQQRLQHRATELGQTVDELLSDWLAPTPTMQPLYKQIFDGAAIPQLLIDPDSGDIVQANRAAAQFYGYSTDQLQAMHIQAINTLSPAEIQAEMQRARRQERSYFEFRHRLASGEVRHVDVYSGPVQTAHGQRLYSIIIDANERKAMEAALRESEQRYRTVADFSTEWTYWQKADGSLHYVAPVCEQICGYTPAELLADPTLIEQMILPEDRPIWEAHFHIRLGGDAIQQIQYRIRHRDGSVHWLEHTCRPVFDEAEAFDGYRVSNHDITRRKAAQEQAFALALERERVGLLINFVQNAAHEFRTPLTTISSAVHLLLRTSDPEYRARKAEQIEEHIGRITNLLDMLLLMLKLENEDEMRRAPLDLRSLLLIVCEHIHKNYDNQREMACALPASLPPVSGHHEYLTYALRQVLDNACRYTAAGDQVTLEATQMNGHIRLEIQDTGPGIPAEYLPHIFETFWRHDAAHTTPGLGLGLPIARKIIHLHQGEIDIISEPGQGTRCVITLPVAGV